MSALLKIKLKAFCYIANELPSLEKNVKQNICLRCVHYLPVIGSTSYS